jgi:hypothetical protein
LKAIHVYVWSGGNISPVVSQSTWRSSMEPRTALGTGDFQLTNYSPSVDVAWGFAMSAGIPKNKNSDLDGMMGGGGGGGGGRRASRKTSTTTIKFWKHKSWYQFELLFLFFPKFTPTSSYRFCLVRGEGVGVGGMLPLGHIRVKR